MAREYRYHKGSAHGQECVEFDVTNRGQYITTCVVSAYMLSIGIATHPCGNGDDIKLSDSDALEILRIIKKERDSVKYSGRLKTLEGWRGCGLNLDEYLTVGDAVDEELVDEQAGCVPPRTFKAGLLQVGEPYSSEKDENNRWRDTYATFCANGENWKYCGHCFANDTVNRVEERDRIAEAIQKIKERKNE